VAGQAQGPGAQPATVDQHREPGCFTRAASLPARQAPIAHRDPVQRGERSLRRGLDALGHDLLGGEVARAQQPEAVDQLNLLVGRTADQPAVVKLS